eukprot:TRINITY_DN5581_c0_g1_i1.p1 TRINITY_DN5581_c0_g1~~TRINITY_DN5581_c0_g1_i1.p1  ORF type:complete len:131 (-),score=21.00 TRINITY_DN5581_c0_g1_i1:227-619(-)
MWEYEAEGWRDSFDKAREAERLQAALQQKERSTSEDMEARSSALAAVHRELADAREQLESLNASALDDHDPQNRESEEAAARRRQLIAEQRDHSRLKSEQLMLAHAQRKELERKTELWVLQEQLSELTRE